MFLIAVLFTLLAISLSQTVKTVRIGILLPGYSDPEVRMSTAFQMLSPAEKVRFFAQVRNVTSADQNLQAYANMAASISPTELLKSVFEVAFIDEVELLKKSPTPLVRHIHHYAQSDALDTVVSRFFNITESLSDQSGNLFYVDSNDFDRTAFFPFKSAIRLVPHFITSIDDFVDFRKIVKQEQFKYLSRQRQEDLRRWFRDNNFSMAEHIANYEDNEFWALIDAAGTCDNTHLRMVQELMEEAPRLTIIVSCPSSVVHAISEINDEMQKPRGVKKGDSRKVQKLTFSRAKNLTSTTTTTTTPAGPRDEVPVSWTTTKAPAVEADAVRNFRVLKPLPTKPFYDEMNRVVIADSMDAESVVNLMEAMAARFEWRNFLFVVSPMVATFDNLVRDVNQTLFENDRLYVPGRNEDPTSDDDDSSGSDGEQPFEYGRVSRRFLLHVRKVIFCTRFLARGRLCNLNVWFHRFIISSNYTAIFLLLEKTNDLPLFVEKLSLELDEVETPSNEKLDDIEAWLSGNAADAEYEQALQSRFSPSSVMLKKKAIFLLAKSGYLNLAVSDYLRKNAPPGFMIISGKDAVSSDHAVSVPIKLPPAGWLDSMQRLMSRTKQGNDSFNDIRSHISVTLNMFGVGNELYAKMRVFTRALAAHQTFLPWEMEQYLLPNNGTTPDVAAAMKATPLQIPIAHFYCDSFYDVNVRYDARHCSRRSPRELRIYNLRQGPVWISGRGSALVSFESSVNITLNQEFSLNGRYFYDRYNSPSSGSSENLWFIPAFDMIFSETGAPGLVDVINDTETDDDVVWFGNEDIAPNEDSCVHFYYQYRGRRRVLLSYEVQSQFCIDQRSAKDSDNNLVLIESTTASAVGVLVATLAILFFVRRSKKKQQQRTQTLTNVFIAKFDELQMVEDQSDEHNSLQNTVAKQQNAAQKNDPANKEGSPNKVSSNTGTSSASIVNGVPKLQPKMSTQPETPSSGEQYGGTGMFGPGAEHIKLALQKSMPKDAHGKANNPKDNKNAPVVAGQLVRAKFRGRDAFVTLLKKSSCHVDDGVIAELNMTRSLHHVNINQFIAVTSEPYHICIVQEYCSKGTLASVLARKKIQLDRLFKLSFATDIAAGMLYLHQSPIGSHGRLTSSNILVDSRWFCKIANIPLPLFEKSDAYTKASGSGGGSKGTNKILGSRKEPVNDPMLDHNDHFNVGDQSNSQNLDQAQYEHLKEKFWTAPELLRRESAPARGSQKSDVYSFGIILYEIITRQKPYESYQLPTATIFRRILDGQYPAFRPQLGIVDHMLIDLAEICRLCWDEISAFRPDFQAISKMLQKRNKGKETNLIDQMMEMLENYANNLEGEVIARTGELDNERKRAEELLSRMLPRTVIEELKAGRVVHPETYESVTVYFSDVVGFTKMASTSSPLEIVDFLNDLYSQFDTIIENFDVYKVETIGDAYMVGSGLPIRNGIRHVSEIATLSLEILSCVANFKIRHRPGQQLQLRIGMHSGSVVAGIIGLKMPRYCLFGDTVNYASRMESSGLALRIHVSPQSKQLLDQIGGFHLEPRGLVSMKGKGQVMTYFLVGKDGFNKPLPDLRLAASIEEHEFK